jgi:lysophospholipase L1-like esterase
LEAQILNWNSTHYLPIPNVLSQAYFAKDGFHPNAAAHHQWSEALFDKIQDIKIVKEAEAYPN